MCDSRSCTMFKLLHRSPSAHEHADRLARTVMILFEQRLRDEEIIVSKAVNQEMLVPSIGLWRENSIAS
jgi:hypothetical protein